jgi:hypothetical protein
MAGKSLVSQKISVLRHEGIPQRQSVAMAINMGKAGRLRQGGKYVRANKRKSSRG